MVARTLSAATIAALRLPTVQEMIVAGSRIPQVDQASWARHNAGPATFLEVGPGVLRIRKTRPGQDDHERDLTWESRKRNIDLAVTQLHGVHNEAMALLSEPDMEVLTAPDPVKRAVRGRPSKAVRGKIVGWSRKSRNRMQIRLNSLDWTPLFEAGLEPALVTLTLPGDWQTVAPTPGAYRKLVDRLALRYYKAWGEMPRGVWKMEFQRRGAPHTHILMTPPLGESRPDARAKSSHGVPFAQWLSRTWAEVVNHPDPEEFARHVLAGTGIDYVGEGYRDPRRIALYFGKHGMFEAKDYQNEMPRLWRDAIAAGESSAQFWGVWRLEKAVAVLQLEDRGEATLAAILDPLGIGKVATDIVEHYRRFEEEEERASATDASVGRAHQRLVDDVGSRSSDAVKVERHMKKLSRSLAQKRVQLVRNKYGQLVVPRERIRKVDRTMYSYATGECFTKRSYRIGYYHGGGGFLLVHDGRTAAADIQRILDRRSGWVLGA